MNGKTPISALQELMAARKLPLPFYIEEGFGTSFKCTVHAAGITAVGISSNKKSAKHESAKNALEKLGARISTPQQVVILTVPPSPPENKPFKNYVGELNEYSSKSCLKYPDYEFVTATASEFYFKCTFLGKEVLGKGMNKKDAKQNSAERMLELLQSMDTMTIINDTHKIIQQTTTNFAVENTDRIIALYEALTLKDRAVFSDKSDHVKAIPEINMFEHDNVDELKAKLRQYGINYSLSQLQSAPFIMCARVNDTDLYFLQSDDDSREGATRKVLRDVLEATKSGCSLNTNDLISFT